MDTDPQVRWFGESWGAEINRSCRWAPTPIDDECVFCEEKIAMGDQGILMRGGTFHGQRVPAHLDCLLDHVGVRPMRRTP